MASAGPTQPPGDRRSSSAAGALPVTRRTAAALFIVAYLAANLWFLFLHMMGDAGWHPVSYFFTWDMFPGYGTSSARRYAVGETESGRHVLLLPGPNERFRWGIGGKLPRFDILSTVEHGPAADWLLDAIDADLARARGAHADDPIVFVDILEENWPAHFNLPDDLYREVYGVDDPHRSSWRSLGSAHVDPATGRLVRQEPADESRHGAAGSEPTP
ncbi:MAG: hypothetical protein WED34_16760 [Planctomycetales bacterium]